MTPNEQKAFDALLDDTDILMSIDGAYASYHTKRLASVLHSISADLEEKDAQLCRARGLLSEAVIPLDEEPNYNVSLRRDIRAALSTTAPCAHEEEAEKQRSIIRGLNERLQVVELELIREKEEAKRLRENMKNLRNILSEHDIIVTITPQGWIQIEQGKPPSPYIQKEGK